MDRAELARDARELGFTPQDQIRWLAPAQLIRTGVQVGIAAAFSTVTDNRELQRSFPDDPLALSPDADGGLWFDFTADTGDGFDATYSVATLLAAERLSVDGETLPRGRLLILGGDEVYPTPTADRYADRLRGPFELALPRTDEDPGDRAQLLALPGNHDWYDGLTGFLRVFGQRRTIGGWATIQDRSYFAVRLPGRWWLAGLDSQLGSEIDDPQLDYFRRHLTRHLQPGDGVVLCVASPTWTHTGRDPRAFDSLHYFARTIVTHPRDEQGRVRPTGARVRLWLTGDSHHYAHYVEDDDAGSEGAHLITCGLGGAYLSGTHRLPDRLTLPPPGSREEDRGPTRRFGLRATYPARAESRRLVRGLLAPGPTGLPMRNPGFLRLAVGVHAVLFLLLMLLLGVAHDTGPVAALRRVPVPDVIRLGLQIGLVWLLVLVGAAVRGSVRERRLRIPGPAIPGIGLQLLVDVLALVAAAALVQLITLPAWFPGGPALPDFVLLIVVVAAAGGAAGFVGSYLVALTLALSRSDRVADWQFSAQAIEDRKGFLRIRLVDDEIVVHPVAVDRISRRWRREGDAVHPQEPLRPHLIEPAIRIPREPGRRS